MELFLWTETILIELLLIGTFVALALRQLNLPYTVALVLVGLAVALPHSSEVNFAPELILSLALPPLVFEAARRINWDELRQNLIRVLVLALPGVILTTLIVGGILNLFTPLVWPMAFVFGALISTTDPFAVGPILRNMGVPKRLATLVDGENLLNNVTAIVLLNIVLTGMLTGQVQLLHSLAESIRVLVGGVAVGLVLGWLIYRLVKWAQDDLIETALTTLLAFGSYLLAERLHVSGVLAVVVAGLINGSLRPSGVLNGFWEYLVFLANSLIFLLIGLEVSVLALSNAWQSVLWAIFAVLVARALAVYGLNGLLQPMTERVPMSWLHAWNWSGLRGAIAVALVLSLPEEISEYRELMILMVFGIVLFSLLIQNATLQGLLRRLGLENKSPDQVEY